jgi:hypothetical protein
VALVRLLLSLDQLDLQVPLAVLEQMGLQDRLAHKDPQAHKAHKVFKEPQEPQDLLDLQVQLVLQVPLQDLQVLVDPQVLQVQQEHSLSPKQLLLKPQV